MDDTILFVDDDENILKKIKRQVNKKYKIELSTSALKAIESIKEKGTYSVVIADNYMPEMSGIHFLEKVHELSPDTIRIMFTGNADLELAIEAVNKGKIFHFLTKPCTKETLNKILEIALDKHNKAVKLKNESIQDELTGLNNRRYFEKKISQILVSAERNRYEFSLIFLDINDFKIINDNFGHNIGDQALCTLSNVLKELCRENDVLIRFGGDEFIIIADHTNKNGAQTIVKRIKVKMLDNMIKISKDKQINLSVSAGISAFPADGKTIDELVKIADDNMYIDKQNKKKK